MDAVLSRRSIRKYTSQPVPESIIKELLEAAMCAPSGGNAQPWHFIVINKREVLDEIPKFHTFARMLKGAQNAIMVCADLELEKFKGSWVMDCSAATENILIAAVEKGLGAVWVGIYPEEERIEKIKKLLNIPHHIIPLSIIPLGYPAENIPLTNKYDESKIHYNCW